MLSVIILLNITFNSYKQIVDANNRLIASLYVKNGVLSTIVLIFGTLSAQPTISTYTNDIEEKHTLYGFTDGWGFRILCNMDWSWLFNIFAEDDLKTSRNVQGQIWKTCK